jgi:hypothetical protein
VASLSGSFTDTETVMLAFEYDEIVTLGTQFCGRSFIDMMQHLILACVVIKCIMSTMFVNKIRTHFN